MQQPIAPLQADNRAALSPPRVSGLSWCLAVLCPAGGVLGACREACAPPRRPLFFFFVLIYRAAFTPPDHLLCPHPPLRAQHRPRCDTALLLRSLARC
jgi:hypothetical protein